MSEKIQPFRISIPQADLDDLNERLRRTRWANELPSDQRGNGQQHGPIPPGWEYGVPVDYVRELLDYWAHGFDWRVQEARLNAYPQFITEIDGQTIHFAHLKSKNPDALPLILTHGWPNTFAEYLGLVDELTDDFHLVIPSLPGFGFSGATREKGWDAQRTARAWAELMRRLGYERYGVTGNDAGAIVAPLLGRVDPAGVVAVHVNQIFSFPTGDPAEFEGLSPEDFQYLQFLQSFVEHSVHDKLQQAQPQTIAHALADSPAGQLAWSGQLFGNSLHREDILTNVSIYWFTNTGASSARFYYENHHAQQPKEPTTVPLGLASFAYDFRPLRRFAERDHQNIVSWNEYDRGSHWATHDAPDLLAADIKQFFSKTV
ncbi:epoxide hydrolase family protein [Allorhizocola rhizosphaerae]|uniref:epoxide hydrolase family protein n=1 Tax=Allorhizocola rhizosphaerae TaxID=1872709 RepID=UPI000E3DCE21|nr:epoxide hydrolase family protein [Allorhizocola rhizosphaerae]